MADTRCANPEYQLDVDVMVIEYTVYKAIEAQLELLKFHINNLDGAEYEPFTSEELEKQLISNQLSESFDILLNLFHINHPTAELSGGIVYNIKILEFLTLFLYWLPRTALILLSPGKHHGKIRRPELLPQALIAKFEHERAINVVLRRNWLTCRYGEDWSSKWDNDSDSDHSMGSGLPLSLKQFSQNFEPPSIEANEKQWNRRMHAAESRQRAVAGINTAGSFSLNLSELTPRFMSLFAGMSQAMGCVSDLWFDLAARFMYYAALERSRLLSATVECDGEDFVTMLGKPGNLSWVEECFAWGSVRAPSRTDITLIMEALNAQGTSEAEDQVKERLRAEDIACAMFNNGIDIQAEDEEILEQLSQLNSDAAVTNEREFWTRLRATWRDRFVELYLSQETLSLSDLHHKEESYPVESFLLELLQSIEGLWSCNVSPDISGKPVLVQIEEGGLEGMDQQDFEGFLERVGLKLSRRESPSGSMLFQIRWIR